MNSNHEMYSGAERLIKVALADDRFHAQRGVTYFALQHAGWTILGLDTAYFTKSPMCMSGSLGEESDPQWNWIRGLDLCADKVIALSHHTGLTYDGTAESAYKGTTLWSQVHSAFGGDPAAWYWGHIHNGIVYQTPTCENKETLCRCVGHAAIPFVDAWGLEDDSKYVKRYAHATNPAAGKRRVKNGFALLTI